MPLQTARGKRLYEMLRLLCHRGGLLCALLLAAFALAACDGQVQSAAVGVPLATVAPSDTPAPTSTPAPTFTRTPVPTSTPTATPTYTPTPTPTPNPAAILVMRQQAYPGSELVIEETLSPGSNYNRYIASYLSEGLKIYALLTVPRGAKPATGWPVILFNHGYIPPAQYRTTERYIAYTDAFSRNGYIVLRSDYRGHGDSEGSTGGNRNANYTVDVLNAMASVKRHPDADPDRIGMWGHSMGGQITLRAMVISNEIKAGVIWAGTVGAYNNRAARGRGTAETSANEYLSDISGPVQLHHGTADATVPFAASESLNEGLLLAEKPVEFFSYEGDNHNISVNLSLALRRSVAFFDKYVKNPPP